jgi:hypothetical protein
MARGSGFPLASGKGGRLPSVADRGHALFEATRADVTTGAITQALREILGAFCPTDQ